MGGAAIKLLSRRIASRQLFHGSSPPKFCHKVSGAAEPTVCCFQLAIQKPLFGGQEQAAQEIIALLRGRAKSTTEQPALFELCPARHW
jgi:hypothetical protein